MTQVAQTKEELVKILPKHAPEHLSKVIARGQLIDNVVSHRVQQAQQELHKDQANILYGVFIKLVGLVLLRHQQQHQRSRLHHLQYQLNQQYLLPAQ